MPETSECRFCGGAFFQPALLQYHASPPCAQGFLDTLDQKDEVVDLEIYQCEKCGLVQHTLQAVEYHRNVIRAIAFSNEMGLFRIDQLSKWIHRFDLADKNILEIGCGRGEYLDLLVQSGARSVYGLENSDESVLHATRRGLKVQQGYVSRSFTNPWSFKFDAFSIFSFLEHWPNLKESLGNLHSLIKEGGTGLIEVPNFDFIIEKGLYSEFTTDHIFYFDKRSLVNVLELSGFEVLELESIWHGYIVSAQVKKRVRIETKNFKSKQDLIVSQLHQFTSRFQPSDVVVWGAGHQALAVMALAQLKGKISHVVDSASFKQNKYTPGLHLLIKPPDSLLEDVPQAVVIMAAAYSDEVAATLLQKYSCIKYVAVLREDRLEILKDGI